MTSDAPFGLTRVLVWDDEDADMMDDLAVELNDVVSRYVCSGDVGFADACVAVCGVLTAYLDRVPFAERTVLADAFSELLATPFEEGLCSTSATLTEVQ